MYKEKKHGLGLCGFAVPFFNGEREKMREREKIERLFFLERNKYGRVMWTAESEDFMRENFARLTNPQMAEALGEKLTSVRTKLYSLGLLKQEMEYWTAKQVKYLKRYYKKLGDTELAERFEVLWPKNKPWNKKHIEKKRRYLKLKRTPAEKKQVFDRNVKTKRWADCAAKRWETTGQTPDGEVRYWRRMDGTDFPVIKTTDGWQHWNRWAWVEFIGPIPEGKNIVFKDGDNRNLSHDNLMAISDAELAERNTFRASKGLSYNYVAAMLAYKNPSLRAEVKKHPELIELKRIQLLLNRIIKNEQGN